jgi:hypothetical protein
MFFFPPDAFPASDWSAAGAILQEVVCLLCRYLHRVIDGNNLFPFLRAIPIDMGFTLLHIFFHCHEQCHWLLGSHLSQSDNSWQEFVRMLQGAIGFI